MATNLATSNWTALVADSLAGGTFTFTDTGPTNRSRAYRAVKQRSWEQYTKSEIPNRTSTVTQTNP
jgi:hypothetical protein